MLKLNFDGNFTKDVRRGGYGGVIRDSVGVIFCSYSGSVDVPNSNEAEVFAFLVGCGELRRLGGHDALIEGCSFSAIQWGSGNANYPWTMADRVEEIQYISFQLKCEFNHVFR